MHPFRTTICVFAALHASAGLSADPFASGSLSTSVEDAASGAGIVLIENPTNARFAYRVKPNAAGVLSENYALDRDSYHVYRTTAEFDVEYGAVKNSLRLAPGVLYKVRRRPGARRILELTATPILPAPDVRRSLDQSQQIAAKSAEEIIALNDRIRELELQAQELRIQLADPASDHRSVATSKPVDMGSVHIVDGAGRGAITVEFPDVVEKIDVAASATVKLARCRVTCGPQRRIEIPRGGRPRITLEFDNVASHVRTTGELLIEGVGRFKAFRCTVPFVVTFTGDRPNPEPEDDELLVLTWPAGASVYLTDLAYHARESQTREFLGSTPVRVRLPPGDYRINVLSPEDDAAVGNDGGRWAAMQGTERRLIVDGRERRELAVDVEMRVAHGARVRAAWLADGAASLGSWSHATADAPDHFATPDPADFQPTFIRLQEEYGLYVSDSQAQGFHSVIRKTGFITRFTSDGRYKLSVAADPDARRLHEQVVRLADLRATRVLDAGGPPIRQSGRTRLSSFLD